MEEEKQFSHEQFYTYQIYYSFSPARYEVSNKNKHCYTVLIGDVQTLSTFGINISRTDDKVELPVVAQNIVSCMEKKQEAGSFRRTKKQFEQGGYQSFWKTQMIMLSIAATTTKQNMKKAKFRYLEVSDQCTPQYPLALNIQKCLMNGKNCR